MANYRAFSLKRVSLGLALLLFLSLWLAACSDGAPGTPTSPPGATQAPASNQNQPAVPVNANPPAATGSSAGPFDCSKVFCFGLAQEPVGLIQGNFDPANLVDHSSLQITRQIYETLFEFKPGSMQYGFGSLLKYEPKVSDDGLTYTIRLGKGLRFSDNTSLDAQAVKFNFDRWSDPGNLYHKGDFQTWRDNFGGFPGILDSVQTDGNNNVIVKLKQPMSSFFQVLSMPQFGIVAPSAFNSTTGEMERSIGSNWYSLSKADMVRTVESKYVVLRENKNYQVERYDPSDPNAPSVKSPVIVALVLKQTQDGLEELRKGTIDATDKIKPELISQAAKDQSISLLERNPLNIAFLGMNLTRPPFNNLVVRQAFAAAIDTQSLVKDYYNGLGQPATVLLPPTALGYTDSHDPYPYDPDRARRLLDTAGYNASNPLRLDLWVLPVPRLYYPDPKKIANAIAADLQKVGVNVTVNDSYSWPDFRSNRISGNLDFYMFGWQGENGDPDEFLGQFYGQQRGEGGYENPILTGLIQNALTEPDQLARRSLYKQAQDFIYDQVLILPLAYTKGVVAVRAKVQGYVASPSGIESWATVEVK
jgi:peptide/nickel transport system substrate-binding protein